MTAEEYLQSYDAVRDVAALLARGPHERGEVPTEPPYAWWGFDNFAPWTLARVGFRENPESSAYGVYCRAESRKVSVCERCGKDCLLIGGRSGGGVPAPIRSQCCGAGSTTREEPSGRFIVSDLGEAVRALRLRTGCVLDMRAMLERIPWPWPDGLNAQVQHSNLRAGLCNDGVLRAYPSGDDLPRIICAVMLAARRVAALEVP